MAKKILIVCDVEGTIFKSEYKIEGSEYAPSLWQRIAFELGEKAQREELETQRKWDNGEYLGYSDWIKATVMIHKKYKLNRDRFLRIVDEAEYMPGVKEFFKKLDREKFIPILISGGFMELVRRTKKDLNIQSENMYTSCNYVFDIYGNLVDVDIRPNNFEGKLGYIKSAIKNYGLNYNTDWIFIGSKKSDSHIAQVAPYSFAINAHKDMQNAAKNSIDSFMDAYEDIEAFYDIVNSEKPFNHQISDFETLRQEDIEKIAQENDRLKKENEELKKRNVFLETEIPKPTKVEHIIPLADFFYGENIYFSDEAKKSLIKNSEAGYTKKYLEGIFEQLYYINFWARKNKGEITEDEYNEVVSKKKIKYALSESTECKFRKEYTDSGVLINMHMYMSWLPNCDRPRTYFGWDKNKNKVIISTMCEHKKTSKYKS